MNTPLISNYRNSELLQFMSDVITICDSYQPGQLFLQNQADDLKEKTHALDLTYKQDKGSEITKELVNFDKRRDNGFVGFKTVMEGLSFHYDENIRNAALMVTRTIAKYGTDIHRMNYQAETLNLDNLISEWESDEKLNAAIASLGYTAWVNEIKEANKLFNVRYLARVNEEASSPEVKIPLLRQEAIDSYRNLMKNIDARDTISEDGAYKGLIKELDVLVEKYNNLVLLRSSGKDDIIDPELHSDEENNSENSPEV